MNKMRILILGYSSFLKRRVLPSIKNMKNIDYFICSKSNKINFKEKILFNNYDKALSKTNPNIVYISLINSLHFRYAKKALEKGFNVIVDKPITLSLHKTKKLLRLAKKKRLLLTELNVFGYHNVFNRMLKLCNGMNNILHIQSNFNIPILGNFKKIKETKRDCESDMSTYAASIVRLYTNNKIENLKVFKNYYKGHKIVKSFCFTAKFKNCIYFGNFAFDRPYLSQIKFFTKKNIVISPNKIFALPCDKKVVIFVKENNEIKKIRLEKDDYIKKFLKKILYSLKSKNFNYFYNTILIDEIIKERIRKAN